MNSKPKPTRISQLFRAIAFIFMAGALSLEIACAAPIIQTIYSWAGDGRQPRGALVLGSDGNFYGTTIEGGADYSVPNPSQGMGTIFKMTPQGQRTVLATFDGRNGQEPGAGLTLGADGNFYGTTTAGGENHQGTIFKITSAGELTVLVHFTGTTGNVLGRQPDAALILASDGNLYGTTAEGGTGNYGTIFRMSPAGTFATMVEFTNNGGNAPGTQPRSRLIQASDGALYGTTTNGGEYSRGTIFKLTLGGQFTSLLSFGGTNAGAYPKKGGLVETSGGSFLGTASEGGANGAGTMFKVTQAGVLTTLVNFGSTNGGSYPSTGLVSGNDGYYYGATYGRTIFKVNSSGQINTLVGDLDAPVEGDLTLGSDNNLYGMSLFGGVSSQGTVVKVTKSGTLLEISRFGGAGGGLDGSQPWNLIRGGDGNFYGTTLSGGANNFGTTFKVTPSGALTVLASFTGADGAAPGNRPFGRLAVGPDGNFYGTTRAGGTSDVGTIFKVAPSGALTTVFDFYYDQITGIAGQGASPAAGLTLGPDNNFYGTTFYGGANDFGTIIRLTPNGSLTTLVNFTGRFGETPGSSPDGELVVDADGTIYGTTREGGTYGYGTVFKFTPQGQFSTLVHFGFSKPGRNPTKGLLLGSDGFLYGVTEHGGVNNGGTVYKVTRDGTFTSLKSFDGADGSEGVSPYSCLAAGADGSLYGSTHYGGYYSSGVLFKITPAGNFQLLESFNARNGRWPVGSLVAAPDGSFYGVTEYGGKGVGTVFRLTFGPSVNTNSATGISGTTATLGGTGDADGGEIPVHFEYGFTTDYGGSTAAQILSGGVSNFSTTVNGLQRGSKYHFRAVGQTATESVYGDDATFMTAANTNPVTADDLVYAARAVSLTIDAAANDTDAEGDTLTITGFTQGARGAVSLADNKFIYAADKSFQGSDTFTYTISDGFGGSATAQVTVRTFLPMAGTYTAFVSDTSANEGLLQVTLMPGGTFAGYLLLDGHKYSVRGTVGSTGQSTFFATARGLTPLDGTLELRPLTNTIEGEISDGTLDRHFSAIRATVPARTERGRYIAEICATTDEGESLPYGLGILTVSRTGVVSLSATLGDKSRVVTAAMLRPDGSLLIYCPLYQGEKGHLRGIMNLFSVNSGGTLELFKPAQLPSDGFFTKGFRVNLSVEVRR